MCLTEGHDGRVSNDKFPLPLRKQQKMTLTQNPVAEAIALHIADQTGCDAIDYSLDLIESGLLDSLLIMELLAFIGAEFGVQAKPQDISPARFRSVNSLSGWIMETSNLAGAA